jgi:ferredoxin
MKTYPMHNEGYPTFIVCEGEVYCLHCANKFATEENDNEDITEEERIFSRPDDAGISQAINWETQELYCSSLHGCGEQIQPAYD